MAFGASWQRYCLGSAKKLTVKSCATTAEVFTHRSRSDPLFPVGICLSAPLTMDICFGANYSICIFVYKNVDECGVLNSASLLISWLAVCVLHVKSVENAPTVRASTGTVTVCMLAPLGHIWWTYEHVFSDQHTMFFSIFFLPVCVLIIRDWAFPLFFFLTVRFPPTVSQS